MYFDLNTTCLRRDDWRDFPDLGLWVFGTILIIFTTWIDFVDIAGRRGAADSRQEAYPRKICQSALCWCLLRWKLGRSGCCTGPETAARLAPDPGTDGVF